MSPSSRLIRGFRNKDDRAGLREFVQFNKYTHTHTQTGTTITGTRIGLGRAEGRQKSARNRKIAVDAVRETGETWVESKKNVEKKGLVQ